MPFDNDDLKRLKEQLETEHGKLIYPELKALLARLEAAERFRDLTPIEIQSIVDAMLYTQTITLVSNAHVRALKKIRTWRKASGKAGE